MDKNVTGDVKKSDELIQLVFGVGVAGGITAEYSRRNVVKLLECAVEVMDVSESAHFRHF